MSKPTSCICVYCDEPVSERNPEVVVVLRKSGRIEDGLLHLECRARLEIGGINHLKKLCDCYSTDGEGLEPDPSEMTLHEAAFAAYDYWRNRTDARVNTILDFIKNHVDKTRRI